MRYPTIDQYVDALSDASIFAKTLKNSTLPLRPDGFAEYNSGNFGVVFRLKIEEENIALKCFTRHQWGRLNAYQRLVEGMPQSKYLLEMEYLQKEIKVALFGESVLSDFDTVRMDYIEGDTMSEVISRAVVYGDYVTLKTLSERFDKMALWLLESDFAHGDIKPDNIMVSKELELFLVDYDGVYIPSMSGESQREFGTDGFQHPLRSMAPFNRHLDDYSIALLSVTLRVLAQDIDIFRRFCSSGSEAIVVPEEAILGTSMAMKYIEDCGVVDKKLLGCLRCGESRIKGLYQIISSTVSCEEYNTSDKEILPIQFNQKWGFATRGGEVIIDAIYDSVESFAMGVAVVSLRGKYGAINLLGKEVVGIKWDMMWGFSVEWLALVKLDKRYGFVDKEGRVKIELGFDYATSFSEGFAVVGVLGEGGEMKYGYIDTLGEWVVEPKYSYARPVRDGKFNVEDGGENMIIKDLQSAKK